jgi:hypothetical protein
MSLSVSLTVVDNIKVGTYIESTNKLHVHEPNASVANFIQLTNNTTGLTSSDGLLLGLDTGSNLEINNQETGDIILKTEGTEKARIDSFGNLSIGTAFLPTNASDGFLYIPGMIGTPSGNATLKTGLVPLTYDTTTDTISGYNSGWKTVKSTTSTTSEIINTGNIILDPNVEISLLEGDPVIPYVGDTILDWRTKIGSSLGFGDFGGSYGDNITTDLNGNIYVTGSISGSSTISFFNTADDPIGSSAVPDVSNTVNDISIVIAKYNSSGVIQWRTIIAATGITFYSCAIISDGTDIYVHAWASGTGAISFYNTDTIPVVQSAFDMPSGTNDSILCKYNSDGVIQWRTYIDASQWVYAYNIKHFTNELYISGQGWGNLVYYDTSLNSLPAFNITGPNGSALFSKFDTSGNVLWRFIVVSSISQTLETAIQIDSDGFFCGASMQGLGGTVSFYDSTDVDQNADFTITGNLTSWIGRYTHAGLFNWRAKILGSSGSDSRIKGMTSDSTHVYACGTGFDTLTFYNANDTIGGTLLAPLSSWVAKYDKFGTFIWAVKLTDSTSVFYNIRTIGADLYAIAMCDTTVNLYDASGAVIPSLISTGISPGFVMIRYNNSGTPVKRIRFDGATVKTHVNHLNDDSIIISGRFEGTGRFYDNSEPHNEVISKRITNIGGNSDLYIAKYSSGSGVPSDFAAMLSTAGAVGARKNIILKNTNESNVSISGILNDVSTNMNFSTQGNNIELLSIDSTNWIVVKNNGVVLS